MEHNPKQQLHCSQDMKETTTTFSNKRLLKRNTFMYTNNCGDMKMTNYIKTDIFHKFTQTFLITRNGHTGT